MIFIVKSLKKSKIAQIYDYDPQSAGINVQAPQNKSTPRRLCNFSEGSLFSSLFHVKFLSMSIYYRYIVAKAKHNLHLHIDMLNSLTEFYNKYVGRRSLKANVFFKPKISTT